MAVNLKTLDFSLLSAVLVGTEGVDSLVPLPADYGIDMQAAADMLILVRSIVSDIASKTPDLSAYLEFLVATG